MILLYWPQFNVVELVSFVVNPNPPVLKLLIVCMVRRIQSCPGNGLYCLFIASPSISIFPVCLGLTEAGSLWWRWGLCTPYWGSQHTLFPLNLVIGWLFFFPQDEAATVEVYFLLHLFSRGILGLRDIHSLNHKLWLVKMLCKRVLSCTVKLIKECVDMGQILWVIFFSGEILWVIFFFASNTLGDYFASKKIG